MFANLIIEVVAAALIDSKMRLLLAQRPLEKWMGGLWELPGGKIEPRETKEQALVRELQEELSIVVKESDLISLKEVRHDYEDFQLKMTVFVIHKWQNEIQNNEHQALVWTPINAMNSYSLPAANIELSSALKAYLHRKNHDISPIK
ncbi:MAG: (deoxy)nucleoside triphosphate pyrophosphohydrolase [Alphaproteobacteria bacterium]|nr:(deoxy)nucleoside triphosphate pyrophosphohydrolase [Alphaproteobacteria bacterium]